MVCLSALGSLRNFFEFWLLLEMCTLLFLGLAFSLLLNRATQLIGYFLVQTLASLLILLILSLGWGRAVGTLAIILKLGLAPLFRWFLSSVSRLPSFIFFLSITTQKMPTLLLIIMFSVHLDLRILVLATALSLIVGGRIMFFSQDLRVLIAASSISNNVWLLLALALVGVKFALTFLVVYSLCLLLVFISEPLPSWAAFLGLISVSGLPPFPLFFFKVAIILTLLELHSVWAILLLLFRAIPLTSYIRFSFYRMVRTSWCY